MRRRIPGTEESSERYLYCIRSVEFIKIGVAANIAARVHTMRLSNPHELRVFIRRKMHAAFHCEKKMHEILHTTSIGREWFRATEEEVKAALLIGIAYAQDIHRRRIDRQQNWHAADTMEISETN